MTQTSAPPQSDVIIRSAVPTFLVADVAATARWYAANLGFHTAGAFPKEEPYAYASLMRGPAEIMLLDLAGYQKPDLRDRRPTGLWDAYIRVDGVHPLYQTVEGKPFIQLPLKQQPYGDWEFEVRDPNGYVLVFGGGYS
jgi:catechol 2,3-dioxygenase-like lactoylglutathione lyase family enzyme